MSPRLLWNNGGVWSSFCAAGAKPLLYNDAGWLDTCMSATGDKHVYGNVNDEWVPVCCDLNGSSWGGPAEKDYFDAWIAGPSPTPPNGSWPSDWTAFNATAEWFFAWQGCVEESGTIAVPNCVTFSTPDEDPPCGLILPKMGHVSLLALSATVGGISVVDVGEYPSETVGLTWGTPMFGVQGLDGSTADLNTLLSETGARLWIAALWPEAPYGTYLGLHSTVTDLSIPHLSPSPGGGWVSTIVDQVSDDDWTWTVSVDDQWPINPEWEGPGNPDGNGEWKYLNYYDEAPPFFPCSLDEASLWSVGVGPWVFAALVT